MSDESFSKWFRSQLRRREWTQADFARRSGFSTGTISHWARGQREPDPSSAHKIADVFGLNRDLILALTGDREPDEPLAPDDPATDIVAKVRRVRWNAERVEHITYELDLYLKYDKIAREKGKGA